MKKKQLTSNKIKNSINELLKQSSDARIPFMERFAELQEKRISRLTKAKTRLEAKLGNTHPNVVALDCAISSADKFRQSMQTATEREKRCPIIEPDEWLVFGHIVDGDGNPIKGLRVSISDIDQKSPDELLISTTTDEYGDFSVVYKQSDFAASDDLTYDLSLKIEDTKGNLLFTSKDKVRYNAGKSEYFEIMLADF